MTRITLWTVTLLRVALLPVFVLTALRAQELARAGVDPAGARVAAVAVLLAIGLSDVLDGWIARRYGLTTQLGAIVDAVADKLAQITLVAFFALSRGPAYAPLPLWFLALLVGRDAVLGSGLAVATLRRLPIRVVHEPHGKAASTLVFAILAWLAFGLPNQVVGALVVAAALLIAASTLTYARRGITQLRALGRRDREGAS